MRLYLAVASRSFRRYSTYRAATAAGVFTNTVFGFILAYTYLALWDARPQLGGYDATDAVTFVWIGQSLLATSGLFGGGFRDELPERIRSGDVAIDLYRPIDMQVWWLASDLGRAMFHLLGRGIPPTVIGGLVFRIALPPNLWSWLGFFVAVFLGVIVSFAINYLVVLTTFWLLDSRGALQAAGIVAMFFSGMLLPLNIFPGLLGTVAEALPWSCALQIPADVFLGKYEGTELLSAFGFQAMWAIVLLAAGRLLGSVATRKVVVQGG